jgi:hypothetical protein
VVREFGGSLKPEERDESRATLNRARKALTSEERSVLEEAIGAVQEVSQLLTSVIMVDPASALGMLRGLDTSPDEEEPTQEDS